MSPKPKLLLVRHGHVEGIEPKRLRGRADLPLTSRGEAEASAVARRIAAGFRPAAIYTSPLQRCVSTGAAIAQACGLEARVLDDLSDIDYGAWQFKTHEEIKAANPRFFAAWFATPHLVRFPDGESLQDLIARGADALRSSSNSLTSRSRPIGGSSRTLAASTRSTLPVGTSASSLSTTPPTWRTHALGHDTCACP